jgi:photosystem II stability/assembly factor-like uncharacterized protein
MMKRFFVALVSAAVLYLGHPLAAQDAEDPDLPPGAGQKFDKLEFMRAREEHIALIRGVPHFQDHDPRLRALEEMKAQERAKTLIDPAFWTQLGPAPLPVGSTTNNGRTVAIAVHPSNPDIVYIGAAQGGVYRSLDGGVNWTAIFDSADSLAIGALALAPSNPEILYVGTGEPSGSADSFFGVGLYRIDNASTAANLVGPINPLVTTGVAGTTAFTGRAISEILVHPTDPATIFVSTFTGTGSNPSNGSVGFTVPPLGMRGIYRSINATSASPTFTKLTVTSAGSIPPDTTGDVTIADMVMDPNNVNVIVAWVLDSAATAGSGGVYRTTNALAATPTFSQVHVATNTGVRGELTASHVGGVTRMWAATGETTTSQGALRRSTDGGVTWSAPLGGNGFCNAQCFYDIAVAAHPTVADTVHLGGSPNLVQARSTDGGVTFTSASAGLHVDTHAIVFAPSDPTVMYFASDGGIWRSNDSGSTWISRNNASYHALQFQSITLHPTDREFMLGGTQDNGTEFKLPDGSWVRTDGGDGGYALIDQNATDTTTVTQYHTYFNQINLQIGFARKLTTTPAVGGWNTFFGCGGAANGIPCAPSAVLFYAPIALGPGNPQTIYMGTDTLHRSTDRGTTMPAVSQVFQAGQAVTTIAISPVNDNFRIVGLRNGLVFATTTGANPMTNVTAAAMPDPHPSDANQRRAVTRALFHPTDPNTAWISFAGYGINAGERIWKTTNLTGGAASWVASSTGIPDVPVNSLTVDPAQPNNVYAATDIGVYASTNGGASWFPYSEGLPRVAVFDLAFQAPHRVLRIATHGRGIWERTPLPVPVELQGFEVK